MTMTTVQDVSVTPTDPTPEVSVVCAWYNRADYLRLTLDSLLAQTHSSFEVVLVNDGSPDPKVREILDTYDDPRLTVIHQPNAGFVYAIRRAVESSRGRFLAVQGAGDISFPNRLARQATFLTDNPDFSVVGCHINNFLVSDETPFPTLPVDKPGFDGQSDKAGQLQFEVTAKRIRTRNSFTHGEVMMRRSAYEQVGGYRHFFANAQDADLWLRLEEHGKLGVLEDWLYQRNAFAADGIATSLRKLMIQLAYSQMAGQCYDERKAGKTDDVDLYGSVALLKLRKDISLLIKVLRRVRQAQWYKTFKRSDLEVVRDLYGRTFWCVAWLSTLLMKVKK